MNANDKFIILFMISVVVFVGYFIGIAYLISHDEAILESCHNDAKRQYFIESDNLTNLEKHDLVKSICNKTFSNESLYKRLWGHNVPFSNIERHKEHEINRCECALLGID